jgi:hypothetical protein
MELVESVTIENPDKPGKLLQIHLTKEEADFIMQTGVQILMLNGAIKLTTEKDGVDISKLMDTQGNA